MKSLFKSIVVAILGLEARLVIKKYKPKIVAVTGSVGKTTTKDAIYTVLAKSSAGSSPKSNFVRKSSKSFNSEIGLPLTIIGCPNAWSDLFLWFKNLLTGLGVILFNKHYPEILVLEVGTDRPGDVERVGKWLSTDVSVITRIGKTPVHVEYFDSPEAVKKEKGYLAKAVKRNGTLILNADEEDDKNFFAKLTQAKVLTFGFSSNANVRAVDYEILYDEHTNKPIGISYQVSINGQNFQNGPNSQIKIMGVVGRQSVYSTLAAVAVGVSFNIPLENIFCALSSHKSPLGRMKILAGANGSVIIDDTYNSSPVAAEEALGALKEIKIENGGQRGGVQENSAQENSMQINRGRKIAVLGDMLELGDFSSKEHRALGEKVVDVASVLITVGLRAGLIAEGAKSAGFPADQIFSFDDSVLAGKFLKKEIKSGDIVLCKGSQGVRMEKTVYQILANPDDAGELLVRQEPEWQKR